MLLTALIALGAEILDSGGENKHKNRSKNCYPLAVKTGKFQTHRFTFSLDTGNCNHVCYAHLYLYCTKFSSVLPILFFIMIQAKICMGTSITEQIILYSILSLNGNFTFVFSLLISRGGVLNILESFMSPLVHRFCYLWHSQFCCYEHFINMSWLKNDWRIGEHHSYNVIFHICMLAIMWFQRPVWRFIMSSSSTSPIIFTTQFSTTCRLTRMQLSHYSRTECISLSHSADVKTCMISCRATYIKLN